jgi:hypothetical protein
MALFGIGGSKSSSSQTERVDVPPWLMPFYQQLVGTGSGALSNLAQLSGGNLVAPFDPMQTQGQNLGAQNALNYGQQATDVMAQTAGGQGLESILDPSVYNFLSNLTDTGQPLSQDIRDTLGQFMGGQGTGPGGEALAAHARGDYLYGGEGFNNALTAAMDQIQPQVQSRFGVGGGAGAATGGLAQSAFNQGTSNAFANLYNQNLNRQMGAANTLTGQGLSAANMLGGFEGEDMARRMSAASMLGNFGMQERGNQLNAAAQLPMLSMFGPGALMDIGAQRQGHAQQQIDAPIMAQLQLLNSVYGGAPAFADLLGRSGTGKSKSGGFKFGF